MDTLKPWSRLRALLRRGRVPVVLQMASSECGAACLAMMLGHHGRPTRINECRERCGPGRDGLTARAIAEAGRSFGLRVKGFSIEASEIGQLPLPVIAHWNFDHFVVIEEARGRRVRIVDPAEGRRWVTADELDKRFTGVVLCMEPGRHLSRSEDAGVPTWRRYLTSMLGMRGVPGILIQVLIASLMLQVLGLVAPLLTKFLVDDVLPIRAESLIPVIAVALAGLSATLLVTHYLRSALMIQLQARLDSQLMLGFLEHLLSLPFRFFQQRTSGDLLMRLSSNSVIREVLTAQTVSTLLDGGLVVVYLVLLFLASPLFAAVVMIVGALQILLLLGTTRSIHELTGRELAAQAESEGYLVEVLTGVPTLKASGSEARVLDHWTDLFFKHLNLSLRRNQIRAMVDAALTTLRGVSPVLLLGVGAYLVLAGSMSLGTMLALSALGAATLTPLASLVSNGQRLQLVGAHLARLADVLEAQPEETGEEAKLPPELHGEVEVKNLDFRYDQDGPLVLSDVSLHVSPGQKVALVGRSGSGKSTLAMLLLGLYEPTSGSILFDGVDIQRFDKGRLRSRIGVVLQESFLFSGSLRHNIAFHDPGMERERVTRAAHLAGIGDELEAMPMGYETRVAERGEGLSGGQRQRVSLARAVATDPALLILDEATSHLDPVTEAVVEANLARLECTRIVVAHRLSTVRDADQIFVLDEGRIVERGTHQELSAVGGHYARLIQAGGA